MFLSVRAGGGTQSYAGSQAIGIQRAAVGSAPNMQLDPQVVLAGDCSFAGCSDFYTLSITGDDNSGTIGGTYSLSNISAVKSVDGVTLTGTFRVAEGGYDRPLHYVDYSFSAVRVP